MPPPFAGMAAVAFVFAQAALACPDPDQDGQSITKSPGEAPQAISVVAGGDDDGRRCGIKPVDHPGVLGFLTEAPAFTLTYQGQGEASLEIGVEGTCDTVLLVNAGPDVWYFDDDAGGNEQPLVTVDHAPAGTYDIWVGGFFQPTTCDATLILRNPAK